MSWNGEYERLNKPWGEKPSELAVLAVEYLQKTASISNKHTVLDIGCGYGRDSLYLHEQLGCKVTGIDTATKAIELANSSRDAIRHQGVNFSCADFMKIEAKRYNILFASNLYQLLQADERKLFRRKVTETLKQNGLLFLSAHAASDPQHYGKGTPHPSEANSFYDGKYLHLCTREELLEDFGFLDIKMLKEHEYLEPRADGTTHHHISWILIGKYLKNP
jgi:cyclopropane fatty-acyl-phospholipid synthase-like methyltransferase